MGKEIKRVGVTDIVFEFDKQYKALYGTMVNILGEKAKIFATIEINNSSRTITWFRPQGDNSNYESILKASDEERGVLKLLWETKQMEMLELFKHANTNMDLSNAVRIPDDSYLFYMVNRGYEDDIPEHKYRLLVAGWGCSKAGRVNKGSDSVSDDLMKSKENHQNVIVEMLDATNNLLQNSEFDYLNTKYHVHKSIKTNSEGRYNQGLTPVRCVLEYTYLRTGQKRQLEVVKNKEIYQLIFAPLVSATITVVSTENEPLPNYVLEMKYSTQNWTKQTDVNGKIYLSDILLQEGGVCMELQAQDGKSFSFQIKENDNNFTIVVETEKPLEYRIKTVQDGNAISDYKLRITCGEHSEIYISDSEGIINLPFVAKEDSLEAENVEGNIVKQSYQAGEIEEFIYEVPKEEIILPEDPKEDPEDPKEEERQRYLIIQNPDGKPAQFHSIQIICNGQIIDCETDSEGKIELPKDLKVGDKFTIM